MNYFELFFIFDQLNINIVSSDQSSYLNAFFALACIASGLFLVYMFISAAIFSLITVKKWHDSNATVIEYAIKPTENNEGWYKAIKYTYKIKGITFIATTLSHNLYLSFQSASHTDRYYSDYHVGQQVHIKYNPKNPEQAVIEYKFDWMNILWAALGCGILMLGYSFFPYK